ncbi:MAG: hypothetical protein ABJE66_15110 [Deltaproteobacteria bacterium]
MRGVVLAVVAVAVAGGAILLYVLATRPPPTPVRRTSAAPTPLVVVHVETPDAAIATARAEREAALETLRRSGPADETWSSQAGAVIDSVKPAATVSDVGCYVVGCGATLTFDSDRTYRDALAQLASSAPYRAWTGGKQLTSPEVQSDGHVVVELLLFRPD